MPNDTTLILLDNFGRELASRSPRSADHALGPAEFAVEIPPLVRKSRIV